MGIFTVIQRPAGMDATAWLLPTDGARAAEHRTHPRRREPFGVAVPGRLALLPHEVERSVAAACDANLGLGGEARASR